MDEKNHVAAYAHVLYRASHIKNNHAKSTTDQRFFIYMQMIFFNPVITDISHSQTMHIDIDLSMLVKCSALIHSGR